MNQGLPLGLRFSFPLPSPLPSFSLLSVLYSWFCFLSTHILLVIDLRLFPISAQRSAACLSFTFTVFAAPATPLFFDPLVAIGYEYEVQSGPSFASVLLPNIGDGKFRLELWDGSAWVDAGFELEAGVSFDLLASVSADGLRKFRIVGIETDVALNPDDPNAFVTGLTFIGSGELKLTQTSLTVNVPIPEPSTYAMFIAGLGLMLAAKRRLHRLAAVEKRHDPRGSVRRMNRNIALG